MDGDVVGAVEPLAFVVVGDGPLATARGQPADAAIAMLAGDEIPLAVEREPVAAPFAAVGAGAGEAGRLEVDRQSLPLLPAVDPVAGDVAEEQGAVTRHPHRPLGPLEAAGEHLDCRVLRHERIEARIEAFDRAERGEEIGRSPLLGTDPGDGNDQGEAKNREATHGSLLNGAVDSGATQEDATVAAPDPPTPTRRGSLPDQFAGSIASGSPSL